MNENAYLRWLSNETKTNWWHDSAIPEELDEAITNGAVGTTTNPLLVKQSLFAKPDFWKPMLADIPVSLEPARKAEEIARIITTYLAKKLMPVYERTDGRQGYVCAQVNPIKMGDADFMLDMARRLTKWAPNICVKLPVTNAGLEVLEECIAEGMTVAGTASFTVPQVLAIGERHMRGLARARSNKVRPGQCFAVVMVGRLDEYIRDVAHDRRAAVGESDIIQCGTAVMKKAYGIFGERGYEAVLMPAAMRGTYHVTSLSGSAIVISIAPKMAELFLKEPAQQHVTHIDEPIDSEVLGRLMKIPEFARAYEADGMKPEDFITYGVTQRTMTQFVESGWNHLENYKL